MIVFSVLVCNSILVLVRLVQTWLSECLCHFLAQVVWVTHLMLLAELLAVFGLWKVTLWILAWAHRTTDCYRERVRLCVNFRDSIANCLNYLITRFIQRPHWSWLGYQSSRHQFSFLIEFDLLSRYLVCLSYTWLTHQSPASKSVPRDSVRKACFLQTSSCS